MSAATHRRLARALAIGLLAVAYGMIAYTMASAFVLPGGSTLPDRPTAGSVIVVCSVFFTVPTVGATLAIVRPSNPIGWLYLLIGLGFTVGIFSTEYVSRSLQDGSSLPFVVLIDWLGAWALTTAVGVALIWVPLLFPDGHLAGPRWRPVAWVAAIYLGLASVAMATQPTDAGYGGRLPNPIGIGGSITWVSDASALLMPILGLFAFASLAVRFRRTGGPERQQLKWFLFAAAGLVTAVVVAFATQAEPAWYLVMLGLAALPVASMIAILRYRLYEIDRLVSRTIAYAAVTGGLVVVYMLVNLSLTTVFSSLTRGDSVAVAASTLVAAALFTPVRRHVQSIVDRRFDRARYDGERTTTAFAERLRDQVDLPALTADLDDTVRVAIAPTSVGLWLRGDAR